MKTKLLLMIPLLAWILAFIGTNDFTVKGFVTDFAGKPIAFATVSFQGSQLDITISSSSQVSDNAGNKKEFVVLVKKADELKKMGLEMGDKNGNGK